MAMSGAGSRLLYSMIIQHGSSATGAAAGSLLMAPYASAASTTITRHYVAAAASAGGILSLTTSSTHPTHQGKSSVPSSLFHTQALTGRSFRISSVMSLAAACRSSPAHAGSSHAVGGSHDTGTRSPLLMSSRSIRPSNPLILPSTRTSRSIPPYHAVHSLVATVSCRCPAHVTAAAAGHTSPSVSGVMKGGSSGVVGLMSTGTAASSRMMAAHAAAVAEKHDMFCFQCEQTRDGVGCTTVGVCGKQPQTAALQDLLVHAMKGLSEVAVRAKDLDIETGAQLDFFAQEAIFATLTNVNFHAAAIQDLINETVAHREELRRKIAQKEGSAAAGFSEAASFAPAADIDQLTEQAHEVGIESRRVGWDEDIFSLQELLTYGIKGTAAYAAHAFAVGKRDPAISSFIYEAFAYMSKPAEQQSVQGLLGLNLKCGEVNLRAMEILNQGHISSFGTPEPTTVRTSPVKGKCIAVSGHDIRDLYELLVATQGTGVNVYSHGELLPAHAYPELKKFPHFVGNYGGPWQLQKMEFAAFPGPILVTTNCILTPKPSYQDRIYSANAVGHPLVTHIKDRDFTPIIQQALDMQGFPQDAPLTTTMTGFGHDAVLSVADTIVTLVKEGKIKRFFLIGGCDGFEGERSYYRDLALSLPKDTVVLTLACGKYRFNKMMDAFGLIEGTQLPRVMDIGQCNDAYSAIRITSALAEAFDTDVNSLPLSMVISWFEQKAVAVLLTLLHLGIRNIRIGPKLPAFVTPNVLNVLVEKYQLTPIGGPDHVQDDMAAMMAAK